MLLILVIVLLVLLLFAPSWWVQRVLRRHHEQRDDFPGTGGDMAWHLINKLQLHGVTVESTLAGDHYDPMTRTVRLTDDKLNGKTLTSVVVAAHEVGHAYQHARREWLFQTRTGLALVSMWLERIIPLALLAIPLLALVFPAAMRWGLLIAVSAMLLSTFLHFLTLPVEWDASFGKALPWLEQGQYLAADDHRAARRILQAAALTYLAASLVSLLNVARWWRYLRR
ncbi:MAG: zinc metallopeptidase [Bacterioplanes sp.]|nr:zinc metallopeptidase [Bacterioplanes sp.]